MHRRMGRLRFIALASALLAWGSAAPASAGTIDQAQETANHSAAVGDTNSISCPGCQPQTAGQTFTSGRSGPLDRVDLYLGRSAATSTPLTVELRAVASGCPSDVVLWSASVQSASVASGAQAWTGVDFPSPPSVTAGAEYAIVLRVGGPGTYNVGDNTSDVYTAGQYCQALGSGPFIAHGGDLAFRTYVDDETTTTPQPTDTSPPETQIDRGPAKHISHHKATFGFAASEPGATFECSLKGTGLDQEVKQFNPCESPRKYKHLAEGRYRFRVRAIDAAGNMDATPAKDRFRVG